MRDAWCVKERTAAESDNHTRYASSNPLRTPMTIIRNASDLRPGSKKVCLAIGVFDGVHLGHQQVIRQMVTDAEQQEAVSVAITFDRHPNTVVAPDRVPPLIYSLPQKLRAIATLVVETTLLIHFDEPFSRQSGEQFIRGLARDFGRIHSICVGDNFTFGHRRSGNVDLLKKLGEGLKFTVHGLAAVSLDGEPVSSTRIREAIRSGQLDLAGQMLGRGYSLAGTVVRGDQLGRRLGFPTANIDSTGLVLPPTGVYAVHASVQSRTRRGVLNIGYRPTVQRATPELRVEVHLLDFADVDLYGEELELKLIEKIRDEQKFPSLETLKQQIARDIATAKTRFGTENES
jgi:riboflavin kinase/FMN adenylyltransferase